MTTAQQEQAQGADRGSQPVAGAPEGEGGPVVDFDTHPDRYHHWRLSVDGEVATVTLHVDEAGGLVPGYELKMNSYDLEVTSSCTTSSSGCGDGECDLSRLHGSGDRDAIASIARGTGRTKRRRARGAPQRNRRASGRARCSSCHHLAAGHGDRLSVDRPGFGQAQPLHRGGYVVR